MRLHTLLTVHAVLAIGHGLGFIVLPGLLLALYQIQHNPASVLMGQLFGAELLVVAIICWHARAFTEARAINAVLQIGLWPNLVGGALALWAVYTGAMGVTGWLGVLIYAGLAAGFWQARRQQREELSVLA